VLKNMAHRRHPDNATIGYSSSPWLPDWLKCHRVHRVVLLLKAGDDQKMAATTTGERVSFFGGYFCNVERYAFRSLFTFRWRLFVQHIRQSHGAAAVRSTTGPVRPRWRSCLSRLVTSQVEMTNDAVADLETTLLSITMSHAVARRAHQYISLLRGL